MIDTKQEIEGHRRRNELLMASLAEKGVDLEQPRSAELHFWAFAKRDAVMLARDLYQEGLLVLTLAPVPDATTGRWNIEAGIKDSAQNLVSDRVVVKFVELAAKHGSKFDGWGMPV